MKQRPTDRSEMYVLSDPRRVDRPGTSAVLLDDIAHVAVRALGVDVAVIVIDNGIPAWNSGKTGIARAAGETDLVATERSSAVDLANPVVADAAGFAFYAATPVRDVSGMRIGTLAILAREPRAVSEEDLVTFRKIATIIEQSR